MGANTSPARARAAWAGIVFAVLFVVGTLMAMSMPSGTDKYEDNPGKLAALWSDYYSDSGHRTTIVVGFLLIVVSAIAFVVFANAVSDRLADAGASSAGRLVLAGSVLFAAMIISGGAAIAWLPGANSFGNTPLPESEIVYLGNQLGFGLMLTGGGAAAGLSLVPAGYVGLRTRVLPGWLGWAGVVIGVLVFALGSFFLPMALLALWVLVAAIVMLRRPASA